MIKVICELCGKEISKSNYSKHLRGHKNHPEQYEKKISYKLNHEGLICQFCGKEYKNRNSLCNHERLCKENPNRQLTSYEKTGKCNFDNYNLSILKGERKVWNDGLTKETDSRVASYGRTFSQHYKEGLFTLYQPMNDVETQLSHKETMKNVYAQKVQDGEFHTKGHRCGWYKDIWCDSSWELAWVIYSLENGIKFERNHKGFKYIFNNEYHTYYPDFYLPDKNVYIEIKGWYTEKDKAKHEQFTENLIVLLPQDMQKYLDYVVQKYGENYISLYTII